MSVIIELDGQYDWEREGTGFGQEASLRVVHTNLTSEENVAAEPGD